jgi:hypothetical protein
VSLLPWVLLLDDGELDWVRQTLERLAVRLDQVRGDASSQELERPYDLVVSSVRRAPLLANRQEGLHGKPTVICVHNQDFLPLRERLRELGCDFLVHSRIEPQVLRLLFVHVLYRGPEQRSDSRLLVGSPVLCRIDERKVPATLVDLTLEGCRLLCRTTAEPGRRIFITLPQGLSLHHPLELSGRIVRIDPDTGDDTLGRSTTAVAFDELGAVKSRALEAILEGRAIGTRVTRLSEPVRARATPRERDAAHPGAAEIVLEEVEQRSEPRVGFPHRITTLRGEAKRIVLGHDLSLNGMRVEADDCLPLGAELDIELFGSRHGDSVRLHAIVARDDGERGTVLRFLDNDSRAIADLERIVRSSPPIASAHAEEGGVVVSMLASQEAS